ncbi:hypothetical protein RB195_001784 [Necator americanus]|uniref:Uncharacterized protein n=1 Tax=Necator americanus TaxID=51031 RepID=A0ABR1DGA1_NECAM
MVTMTSNITKASTSGVNDSISTSTSNAVKNSNAPTSTSNLSKYSNIPNSNSNAERNSNVPTTNSNGVKSESGNNCSTSSAQIQFQLEKLTKEQLLLAIDAEPEEDIPLPSIQPSQSETKIEVKTLVNSAVVKAFNEAEKAKMSQRR